MADGRSYIWIDSTFLTPSEGELDTKIEVVAGDARYIGDYSIPVVINVNTTSESSQNLNLEYFNKTTSVSGIIDIYSSYRTATPPLYVSLVDIASEYFDISTTESGIDDVSVIYATGYNAVSGTVDERVHATFGKRYYDLEDISVGFYNRASISGILDRWANYTNFTGEYEALDVPIPVHSGSTDYGVYCYRGAMVGAGVVNKIVDISFAGWVPYPFAADVACALSGTMWNFDLEVESIEGIVEALYTDVMSTNLKMLDLPMSIDSTTLDWEYFNGDVNIRDGRITRFIGDVYSTTQNIKSFNFSVGLYSLKIDNFSLSVDEYVATSETISVDVLDDECPISVSGTYMLVSGKEVPISFEAITNGYRIYYSPADNFASLDGPTEFLVHTENECGDWLEESYYLTVGALVGYDNTAGENDFGFDNDILIRIEAEDLASCPTLSSLAWSFTSAELRVDDLSASVVGILPLERNLTAEIVSKSTAYFYGKEFEVVITASDFSGNEMTPFVLNYKIESGS